MNVLKCAIVGSVGMVLCRYRPESVFKDIIIRLRIFFLLRAQNELSKYTHIIIKEKGERERKNTPGA